jgi:hypothetical protein
MVLGWIDLVKRKTKKKNEFVSADARRYSTDPRTYEMLSGTPQPLNITSPDTTFSPDRKSGHGFKSPLERNSVTFAPDTDMKSRDDYYAGKARAYVSPVSSYSTPRPPSSGANREWDPSKTHATSMETPLPVYSKRKEFGS